MGDTTMTEQFTPDTEGVENAYIWPYRNEYQPGARDEFRRWLDAHEEKVRKQHAGFLAGHGWSLMSPSEMAAHDAEVAANALREARDGWSEGLPNNGYYEYTSDSDCDGSNPRYFRRMPGAVIEPTTWETCSREEWQAAVDADRIEREAADHKSNHRLGNSETERSDR